MGLFVGRRLLIRSTYHGGATPDGSIPVGGRKQRDDVRSCVWFFIKKEKCVVRDLVHLVVTSNDDPASRAPHCAAIAVIMGGGGGGSESSAHRVQWIERDTIEVGEL